MPSLDVNNLNLLPSEKKVNPVTLDIPVPLITTSLNNQLMKTLVKKISKKKQF